MTFDSSELTGFYSCCGGDCPTTNNINVTAALCSGRQYKLDCAVLAGGDGRVGRAEELEQPHPQQGGAAGLPGGAALPRLPLATGRTLLYSKPHCTLLQTPIETPIWGAPLYSADQFRLPSPPWIWKIE